MNRRAVFIDSWAWIAWAVHDDPAHLPASELIHRAASMGDRLLTTDAVLAESLTRLRYDVGLAPAMELAAVVGELVATTTVEVIFGSPDRWQRALEWFGRYTDQRFSFVDCLSFAVMAELGIQECLTSDPHFATAGFTPLGRR